ncbi:non-ribosomal peptide synthetase, partial [Pseudoalteromonas umbrosa]|uniref:non-ribosomal peptide synthetase n=1 Tax=Pseudoalteromonas umbrosa TaxID=3048489 RepID=UPI0024C45ED5
VPAVLSIDETQTVGAWLKDLHSDLIERESYSYLPLAEIQRLSTLGHHGLFHSLLTYENFPVEPVESSSTDQPVVVQEKFESFDSADYDIAIRVSQTKTLHIKFNYNALCFDVLHMAKVIEHFKALLLNLRHSPKKQLQEIAMLSEAEVQKLGSIGSSKKINHNEGLLHNLFEQQAKKTPNKLALNCKTESLSFSQLNNQANQLAYLLKSAGVEKETLVGLCVSRGCNMIVAMLAILKAGGAFVALDPALPEERMALMVKDADLKYVVSESDCYPRALLHSEMIEFNISTDSLQAKLEQSPSDDLGEYAEQDASQLAYVIYTSGSTGQPKGVMIEHGGLINLALNLKSELPDTSLGAWGLVASYAFDSAMKAVTQLCFGRPLTIITDEQKLSVDALNSCIEDNNIRIIDCTPSLLEAWYLQGKLSYQTDLVLGGEDISHSLWSQLLSQRQQGVRAFNVYGPTEATVNTTCIEIKSAQRSIGKTLKNVVGISLNRYGNEVPVGGVGELYIGGIQLARGYLNQAELTKKAFNNKRIGDVTTRLYKSGDLVKRLENGEFSFVGRVDEQVKIRGFRVELGEIESKLLNHHEVENCVVTVDNSTGYQQLVAYLVCKRNNEQDKVQLALQALLCTCLPDYMHPTAWVFLDLLPLTVNGKVDKRKLPAPTYSPVEQQIIALETDTQHKLAVAWQAVLKCSGGQVGVNSNFFMLGGNSLALMHLSAQIEELFGFKPALKQLFENLTLQSQATLIDKMAHDVQTAPRKIVARQRDIEHIPLSSEQQRLWLVEQIGLGSTEYNMQFALEVRGEFDLDCAEQAMSEIVQRHTVLRTTFHEQHGRPYQQINAPQPFKIKQSSLNLETLEEQQKYISDHVAKDMRQPFDLTRDLMIRASYISLGDTPKRGVLIVNMHHIASDGWSMGLLRTEFLALYQAFKESKVTSLPELKLQYSDYAIWQSEQREDGRYEQQLNYWKSHLAGVPSCHELPLINARPDIKSYRGSKVTCLIPKLQVDDLSKLAAANNATLFMALHSALAIALSRHSNSNDIVIGTPVANRSQQELASMIGFLVNTLPLRTQCGGETYEAFLAHVRDVHLAAHANQNISLEQLVDELALPRTKQHSTLVQIMFSLSVDAEEPVKTPALSDVEFIPLSSEQVVAKFDIDIECKVTEQGIIGSWTFDETLFSHEQIQAMMQHWVRLVQSIVATPAAKLDSLMMLSDKELDNQINKQNTKVEYNGDSQHVCEQFEARVDTNPAATALIYGDDRITYGELSRSANRLARYLSSLGVSKGDRVGVCVEKSPALISSVLAALKLGATYVPIDPNYPASRISHITQDSELSVLVCDTLIASLQTASVAHIIDLSEPQQRCIIDAQSSHDLALEIKDIEALPAYMIYTSGSTGKPKGVVVQHLALNSHFDYMQELLPITLNDIVPSIASFSFDISLIELLYPLTQGATVKLIEERVVQDVVMLERCLQDSTFIHMTPGLASLWINQVKERNTQSEYGKLKYIATGGDKVSPDLLAALSHTFKSAKIWQFYGPTEASMFSVCNTNAGENTKSIGNATKYTQLYIVKDNMIQPHGCVGELYIGGPGLAQGYFNQPSLTSDKFVENTLWPDATGRLYKTGDLVRYIGADTLEFIGRNDEQVKVRGHRIELGEIEAQLNQIDWVDSSIALVKHNQFNDNEITAYLSVNDQVQIDLNAVYGYLRSVLPDYMIPAHFVQVDNWPMTEHGKLDRKALLLLKPISSEVDFIAPDGDVEIQLVSIWAELLQKPIDEISVMDNFFHNGGNSLLAVRLITKVKAVFGIEHSNIGVKDVFTAPVLKNMADYIEKDLLTNQLVDKSALCNVDELEEGEI